MIKDCLFFYRSMRKKQRQRWIIGIPLSDDSASVFGCISLPKNQNTLTFGPCMISPRPLSSVLFFGLVPVASWFIVSPFLLKPAPSIPALYSSFGFSIFAFLATLHLVPALGPTFIKANLKGRDLLKTYHTPMSVRRFCNKG